MQIRHVHLIGVSGTGMGALAMLFRERGARVTGSDVAFDPPIGPALEAAGIECLRGYDAAHLEPRPDLVVVGNAIRRDNAEAVAAEAAGLRRVSMSGALREEFLANRRAVVVCGTHGKTTTTSIAAWVLESAGLAPGWFIGGIPKNLPHGAAIGRAQRSLTAPNARAPFVIEGDEYDAVYWHKQPKFYDYYGVSGDDVVVLTSVEHDHIDIYPDEASYDAVFRELLRRVASNAATGSRVYADASQRRVRELVAETGVARSFYALDGDPTGDVTPEWLAALGPVDEQGQQAFDVFVGGSALGRFTLRTPGAHNVKNALACIALAAESFGVSTATIRGAIASFEGVRRRQELRGEPGGVLVYDDFAHHPTAVDETLRALRRKHPRGKLFAVFEPRSATACRSLHQAAYVGAFGAADRVLLAPLGRTNVPEAERLDVGRLARELGGKAEASAGVEAIVERLASEARRGDVIAVLSNGAFGGIHEKLLATLSKPA